MRSAGSTLINGEPRTDWPVHDRGLQYGDGLFETLSVADGRLRWFERHMARLTLGCERLGMVAPDGGLIRAEALALLGSRPRALIKVILTRGVATARGYRPAGDERPTRIVSVYEWPAPEFEEFRIGLSEVSLGINPKLAGIKHLNRLEQVLAQRDAQAHGWHEALMRSSGGEIVCGTMSNLFVCHAGEWLTAPLAQCGVAGIMRSLVMDSAARIGLALHTRELSDHDVHSAASMFVANVRLGLQPVHFFGGRALQVDARGAPLQEMIDGTLA